MSDSTSAAGRRRVAMLTTVDFWAPGSGHRSRILALARHLANHTDLTIVSPMALSPQDRSAAAAALPDATWHEMALPQRGSMRDALMALALFFQRRPQHACIFQFQQLSWMRQAVPRGVMTLIDTHLVASHHDADVQRIGTGPSHAVISEQQEQQVLKLFDRVIAIAPPDAEVFTRWLGTERVVLAPHALPIRQLPLRDTLREVMVVGGDYAPNHEGVRWLLDTIWPALAAAGLRLHVVGAVGTALRLTSTEQLLVHGIVPDLTAAYAAADVCLNPVRFGGGIKIKTLEALAHGRPLVSTLHGVRGLEDQAGEAFLVADTPDAFAQAVLRLARDPAEAGRLARAGLQLAERRFGADACFGELLRVLGV